jgi:hypothetical protein
MNDAPKLGSNANDRIAATLRAGAGLVPIIGTALAEIVTEFIPGQRLERIESYLKLLAAEIDKLHLDRKQLQKPANVDLIEDGGYQAVRALSEDRRVYIARCVAHGIAATKLAKIRHKRILSLLGDLDDEELTLLAAYSTGNSSNWAGLTPRVEGYAKASDEVLLHGAALLKLERLGLMDFRILMKAGSLEEPMIDVRTGKPQGHHEISELGRLLIRQIQSTAEQKAG